MAHDVFISYSTKDKIIADAVCAKLEENKIRVWIAPRDVPAGSKFAESIIRAINTCKVFVLIWSANTNTSNHILNEINQAFDQGITIIPFRIQDIQPTDEMRYYFGRTHWLDAITPPLENHIAILRDTILVNLGREIQPVMPAPYSQELSGEVIQPSVKPSIEKEPAIEQAEAVKPPLISPRQKKSQKIDKEIRPTGAASANLTRFIPIAAVGLAVLTLVVLLLSGVFKGSPSAGIAQASPSPTSPITPTSTIRPTATSTPIPAWVEEANALAEPILAAINNQPPYFEDDFSQVDTNWISPPDSDPLNCFNAGDAKMSITDGSMKYSIINCQVGTLQYTDMQYANYVLQLDVNFQQAPLGLEFRNWGTSSLGGDVQLGYYLQSPEGNWGFSVWRNEDFIGGVDGNYSLDFLKPVTITIINKSPTFIVYLDSSLLTFYNTQEEYAGFALDFTVNSWDVTPTETLTLELDNVKIWDLDKIEEIEEAIAISESILAAVQDQPPDFEDDFSQVDPDWLYGFDVCPDMDTREISIKDSSIQFTLSADCRHIAFIHPDFQYQSGDYVMQIDINFLQSNLGFEFNGFSPSGIIAVDFMLRDEGWVTWKPVPNSDEMQTVEEEPIRSNASKPATLTIIKKGTVFLFYLNSMLLTVYEIQVEDADPLDIRLLAVNVSDGLLDTETLLIDNIKVWDLDKIEY